MTTVVEEQEIIRLGSVSDVLKGSQNILTGRFSAYIVSQQMDTFLRKAPLKQLGINGLHIARWRRQFGIVGINIVVDPNQNGPTTPLTIDWG